MFNLYTTAILITIIFLLITVSDVLTNRLITKETRKWVVVTCILIGVAALGECIGVLTNGASSEYLMLHKIAKTVEFSSAPAIGVAAAIAYGAPVRPKFSVLMVIAHAVFEVIAMCFGWVFSIDAQNFYHREALFPVYVIAFSCSILYAFYEVLRSGKEYQVEIDSTLVLTLCMLVFGIFVLILNQNIRISYLCIAIGNQLFYTRYYKMMMQVDALTWLLNRRCYEVHISDLRSRAVLLLFDVNSFKQVNDTYGHSVGDICLKNIAEQLRIVYGKYGHCYRIGGDEFCVILQDGIEKTEELKKQFLSAIEEVQKKDSRMPGVSVGYAYYDAAVTHIQSVVEEADAMLYRNKLKWKQKEI